MGDESGDSSRAAKAWIESIEGVAGEVRNGDLYPYLRSWVERANPVTLLDIGCGQGIASEKLDLVARRYTGVDISSTMLDRARTLYPGRKFVLGNACSLPVPDDSIDAAYSIAAWHLLEDPLRAAQELKRVLKKGGHFLIVTAHPDTYATWRNLYPEKRVEGRRCQGRLVLPDGTSVEETLYLDSAEEILRTLESAGLQIHGQETIRHFLALEGTNE